MGYSRLPVNPKYDWTSMYNNVNSLDIIANKDIRPILDQLQKRINERNILVNELRHLENDNSPEADDLIQKIADAEVLVSQCGAVFKHEYNRTIRVKESVLPNSSTTTYRDDNKLRAQWTGD
jgi:flavorubredoxin